MKLKPKINLQNLPWFILTVLIIFSLGFGIFRWKVAQNKPKISVADVAVSQKDIYAGFLTDIYDVIQQNYWNKISDADLAELFRSAAEKVNGSPAVLPSKDKKGVEQLVLDKTKDLTTDKKKDFVAQVGDVVLANLQPFSRSRLFSQNLVQQLSNEVNNIDTSTNQYANLGVDKNATPQQIEQAYQEKTKELSKDKTPQAKEQLALVERAHEALKAPERKAAYDQTGQEPAVTYRQLDKETFYLKISRFTPTLAQEFQAAAKTVDGQPADLHILILDLRGNIGGAIDQLPQFLGPFLGQDQYAFEYFHQGTRTPYKTTSGYIQEFVRYKKVVILVDNDTQSSAEVMASSLKKYNVGILVGTTTKGWGTIERLFDIPTQIDPNEHYYAYLVHTLTLGDDNQPIEGKGVSPLVDINSKIWEKEFKNYFDNPALLQQVKKLVGK